MFNFIRENVKKIYANFTQKAASLFSQASIDESLLSKLETLLISSDVGIATTRTIIQQLKRDAQENKIKSGNDVQYALKKLLIAKLKPNTQSTITPRVIMVVGINGSGKTTFAGKISHHLAKQGKKVLLVCADTFRAAAAEQLQEWGNHANITTLVGTKKQDPASVVFDACTSFEHNNFDHLIIDTAGRIQTKINLMRELTKMRKILNRKLSEATMSTWLTIDAMLGQNSLQQAKIFHEATPLDGLILTKLDGSGKGGIVFAITNELDLPIIYVTFGEHIDDFKPFDPAEYVGSLLEG